MRLIGILTLVFFLQMNGSALSQSITMSGRFPLRDVFDSIKARTGYLFLYNPAVLKKTNPVTLHLKDASVRDALNECIKGQPLSYTIVDRTILIAENDRSSPEVPREIKGRVRDTITSEPLAGVSIRVMVWKEGKWMAGGGAITDEMGFYTVKQPKDEAIFVFSHAGFESVTLPVRLLSRNGLVQLKHNSDSLRELVVNKGYYIASREMNTGDVTTINALVIGQQPVSDPMLALQGRVSGLMITRQSGLPGAALTVQLRGQNSIASGNDPFYIVDGVPFPSTLLQTVDNLVISSFTTGGSPFSFLNPSDIESITVLKDADALAIYGSQGANGAVLITTKKGKAGGIRLDVDASLGAATNPGRISLLNTPQYLGMRRQALKNEGQAPGPDDYDLMSFDPHRYTDWQKMLTGGAAPFSNVYLSASGGYKNTSGLLSVTLSRQGTVLPGDFSDRKVAVHFSGSHRSDNGRFKASMTSNYLADDNILPSSDPTYAALTLPPNAPGVYNADGSLHWEKGFYNPVTPLKQPYTNRTSNLVLSGALGYELLPGLQVKLNTGIVDLRSRQTVLTPIVSLDPRYSPRTGSSSFISATVSGWILEPVLSYSRRLGPGKLSALAGMTMRESLAQGRGIAGNGYTDDTRLGDLSSAAFVYTSLVTYTQYRYEAVYGQLSYSCKDRYVVNFTGRRDGSSRFGPGRQFATFGALGVAWLWGKEAWVRQMFPFISSGKFRGSIGTTGNDQIGDYGYLNLWTPNFYPYLGSTGFNPTRLYNPDFAWEINRKLELGLESGFIADRIRISASWYDNRSGNQLLGQPLASTAGFTSVTANLPAVIRNTGVECEVSTVNIKGKNFGWTTMLNLTIPDNKLVSYPGLAQSDYADAFVVGQPLNIEKLIPYQGVDPVTGLYVFIDANGKLTSSPDVTSDGTALRQVGIRSYGGLANTITWKGFSVDVFFNFAIQTANDLSGYPYSVFDVPGSQGNQPSQVQERWQKTGDNSMVQRYGTGEAAANAYYGFQYSTRAISGASYVRLKNCSLSYNLPGGAIRKLHLSNARFYVEGQDILTFTDYNGLDPETLNANLPPLRMISAGTKLTF